MDRVALDGRDPPLGVHPCHVLEEGNVFFGKAHAGTAERTRRIGESRPDRLIETGERQALGNAEPQSLKGFGFERPGFVAGHDRIRGGTGADAPCDRSHGIERVGQRERALGRHPEFAWLESDDAAERGRNPRRAAGIGADGDLAHAVRDRDRRARRRAAGNARAVGRIARRAVMRIDADDGEGEFDHVGLGDDDGACGAQPSHHNRVGGSGRRIGENLGARARGFARDIEQILDADNRAVERTERDARARSCIRRIRRIPRCVGVDGEAGNVLCGWLPHCKG